VARVLNALLQKNLANRHLISLNFSASGRPGSVLKVSVGLSICKISVAHHLFGWALVDRTALKFCLTVWCSHHKGVFLECLLSPAARCLRPWIRRSDSYFALVDGAQLERLAGDLHAPRPDAAQSAGILVQVARLQVGVVSSCRGLDLWRKVGGRRLAVATYLAYLATRECR
jgi:hypothetical protein